MRKLIIFSIIGFFAQLVDGSLGMGFGATSASLLLFFGVAPAIASASIHMAEIGTTAASGASHLYFKNVDRSILLKLVVPGSISAFVGAAFLSSIPGDTVKPFIAVMLTLLGVYILFRFLGNIQTSENAAMPKYAKKFLIPLGLVGGFFDAVGGGGWGPITTPALLAKKGASPRKVVGTVATSEFAIAVSATLGFLLFLGWEQFNLIWVAAFVIGGVVAAPIAAYLVKVIPSYMLGVLVGGLIILTNLRTLIQSTGLQLNTALVYGVFLLLWVVAITYQILVNKSPKSVEQNVETELG
ncbi:MULTISPECIES: sulfite exporter TauE/SafE family protein [unclassified Paenibacillus]|uniref:sulfite exporter TauE/SafE family protein n=1 Tax=unclassified Paenibacillus TaxID=185978 RepID=UPI001AE8A479|nr:MULTISPECIES: sulfite exporter TauE/SafE family protein [unclassified Paenibacillus]MBP1155084.1 putative membrane protein YfcA [Paenibacillus sp. PvP091]MBP1169532.1 putative membrane protein YfcA [Paenibacillus sp. PvR098]MBP2440560.1 putative membrane protein YfcA [Paenibacillus sp. PvP052]